MSGKALWHHFSALEDPRQRWKVVYPLPEIMLLVLCATLAAAEDFVEVQPLEPREAGFPAHDAAVCPRSILRKFDLPYITDYLAHALKDILAENFGVSESTFANLPKEELYIFPGPKPGPLAVDKMGNAGPISRRASATA